MPVTIDQMTAEVVPTAPPTASVGTGGAANGGNETKPRPVRDDLERLESRAARLRAD